MSDRLRGQLERLSVGEFGGIVLAAVAVACADGTLEQQEVNEIVDSLNQVTEGKFSRDDIVNILNEAFGVLQNVGVDGAISQAANQLSGDRYMAEVGVIIAAAIGWAGRGIGAAEGARIRSLSDQLGIDEGTYFELLSDGKSVVGR